MNTYFFAFIGMWETVAILAVILVLFGAKKVPELAKGLGQGIKEFRKATRAVEEDLQRAIDEDDTPPPPRKIARPPAAPEPEKTVPHSPEPKS
jgi:sec-independent protein translocase protein TatA